MVQGLFQGPGHFVLSCGVIYSTKKDQLCGLLCICGTFYLLLKSQGILKCSQFWLTVALQVLLINQEDLRHPCGHQNPRVQLRRGRARRRSKDRRHNKGTQRVKIRVKRFLTSQLTKQRTWDQYRIKQKKQRHLSCLLQAQV